VVWFGLWCLMPLSTVFQFYWRRKPEYQEKTTDLSQVTDWWFSPFLFLSYFFLVCDENKYNFYPINQRINYDLVRANQQLFDLNLNISTCVIMMALGC